MELFSLTTLGLFALLFLLTYILFRYLDADFTTSIMEKYGKDVNAFLNDKVIWITGASSGIGAGIALEAAKAKCKLVLTARNEKLLEEIKSKCVQRGLSQEDVLIIPMDMCNLEAHEGAYKLVKDKFGRLDIMVHNAGKSQRARWEYVDLAVDRDLFELNVFSIINLTRIILPDMLAKKTGTIAVVSSVVGKAAGPYSCSYTASKHALHGYFESLRNEKVGSGIDVCMLCPGPTYSNLIKTAATEKVNEVVGEDMKCSHKMPTERCAKLSLVAIANKVPESWICFYPVLPMMYLFQHIPSEMTYLMKLFGPAFTARVFGRDPNMAAEEAQKKHD